MPCFGSRKSPAIHIFLNNKESVSVTVPHFGWFDKNGRNAASRLWEWIYMTKVDEEKLQGAAGGGAGAGAASVGVGAGAAGTEAAAGAEAGAKAADFKASSASASGAKKEHNVSRRS